MNKQLFKIMLKDFLVWGSIIAAGLFILSGIVYVIDKYTAIFSTVASVFIFVVAISLLVIKWYESAKERAEKRKGKK